MRTWIFAVSATRFIYDGSGWRGARGEAEILRYAEHAREAEPVLAELARDRSITAWVGLSDRWALIALEFLRGHGVPVPGRISVMGFDNSASAFSFGLTSYDFNMPALASAMVGQIVGRDAHTRERGGRRQCIEIPGYVAERSSTGPTPGPCGAPSAQNA